MGSSTGTRASARTRTRDERILLGATLSLICLGLLMVYSATSARAVIYGFDPSGPVRKQLLFTALGLVVLAVAIHLRPVLLKRAAPLLVGASMLMLAAIYVLPATVAPEINGAHRWLVLGGVQIQPSEVAKLALILWVAAMVVRHPKKLREPRDLAPYLIVTGAFALLVVMEPDLGTAAIIVMIAGAMMFVAGTPIRLLGMVAAVGVGLAVLMIAMSPYQQSRIRGFLDPWADPTGETYQTVQAQIAIGSGGLTGRGLGNSIQKNNYLPEAHTDMIGAIIGEELGLVGLLSVIGLFVVIGVVGFRIAYRTQDVHRRLLATGITTMICLQAAINLAQVFGLFPITGVPLPLVSAGGTNLVVSLAGIGILVNISRQGAHATRRRQRPADAGGDRGRGDGRTRQTGPRDRRRLAS